MKLISFKTALNGMLLLLTLLIIFHVFVLAQIIPYQVVWAGRLNTVSQMRRFEVLAIVPNVILAMVLLLKGNYIRNRLPEKIVNAIIWLFVIVFFLNTVGNLFAVTKFEKYVFGSVSLVSFLLCLRIVRTPFR